jgi:hypothetical protein
VVLKYLNKNSHIQAYRGTGELEVWLQSFVSSAVDGSEWLLHNQATLLPGNKPVPIEYKVGSPKIWSGHFDEKSLLPLPGFKPWFIQSVAYSLYHINIQLKLRLYVNRQHSGEI